MRRRVRPAPAVDVKEQEMSLFDNAKDALGNDKVEGVSDAALDKGADAVSDKTGGKFDEQIDKAHDGADDRIGS